MRLSTQRPVNALLVPDSAVQTDQAGKMVMTIGKNGQPVPVPVTVGPVIDGLRVIRSGLAPDAKVIIRGHQRIMPGRPDRGQTDPYRPRASEAWRCSAFLPSGEQRPLRELRILSLASLPNLHRPADLRRGHRHRHHFGRRDLLFRPAGCRNIPNVVPPTITVSTAYPGASAETVADTVAAPIEQQINGVDDMLYMSSQSTGDGRLTITVTFKLGTDLDKAQVLVQNRVGLAEPSLPEEVRRIGVVTQKSLPSWLMAINIISPDRSRDRAYMSNYILSQVRDRLTRVDGIGDVMMFGGRDYAMRVWIDPGRAAARGMTAGEVVSALRAQNVQVAAGTIGQPPYGNGAAYQLNVETQGRFREPREFANIVVKTAPDGAVTRLSDVARVELGADDYGVNGYLSGEESLILGITQRPGTNALAAAQGVIGEMEAASKDFPSGVAYRVIWNPTEFISKSMEAVQVTLLEAIALVVLVIIVFLQSWRAAIIPVVAIPVSLIGASPSSKRSAIRSTLCRCSDWCWRSGSSSTTPSSWSRMSSAIWKRASLRRRPRGARWTKSRPLSSRSCWCSAPCSCRRCSSAAFRASSTASSRSLSPAPP